MIYKYSSSEAALVANGHASDVLSLWQLIVDTDEQTITIRKRLGKSACKRIKQILMEYNEHSKTKHNIFS